MKVKIGDKEYTLKYNNRALIKIEKALDKPILSVFADEKELSKLNTIFVIVHSGIQEDVTLDHFIDSVSIDEVTEILPSLIDVIGEAFNTGVKKK